MAEVNWKEILGWGEDQIGELRFSGFSFLREGKYEKALLFFQSLLILNPSSAYDAQTLGGLYLQMGKKAEALETLNRALEIEPDHQPTQLNKVKALLLLDRKEEAFQLAQTLSTSRDPLIAGDATALLAAYR